MQDREEPDILEELVNRSNLFLCVKFLSMPGFKLESPYTLDRASALVHLVTFDMELKSSDLCFRLASILGPSSRRPTNLAS